jgi:hypothetical protein
MAIHWHSVDVYNLTKADRQAIKDSFAADRDKLAAVIAAPGGTNTNRDANLLDLAQVERRILRAVKALVL